MAKTQLEITLVEGSRQAPPPAFDAHEGQPAFLPGLGPAFDPSSLAPKPAPEPEPAFARPRYHYTAEQTAAAKAKAEAIARAGQGPPPELPDASEPLFPDRFADHFPGVGFGGDFAAVPGSHQPAFDHGHTPQPDASAANLARQQAEDRAAERRRLEGEAQAHLQAAKEAEAYRKQLADEERKEEQERIKQEKEDAKVLNELWKRMAQEEKEESERHKAQLRYAEESQRQLDEFLMKEAQEDAARNRELDRIAKANARLAAKMEADLEREVADLKKAAVRQRREAEKALEREQKEQMRLEAEAKKILNDVMERLEQQQALEESQRAARREEALKRSLAMSSLHSPRGPGGGGGGGGNEPPNRDTAVSLGLLGASLPGGFGSGAAITGAAISIANDAARRFFTLQRAGAAGAGGAAQGIAGNRFTQARSAAREAQADMVEQVPAIGPIGAAALRGASFAQTQQEGTMQAFRDRGRELAQYDPRLAQSYALADMRKMQADIREARQLGGQYAKLNDAMSQREVNWQDASLPVKAGMLDPMTKVAEEQSKSTQILNEILEIVRGSLNVFSKPSPNTPSTSQIAAPGLGTVNPGASTPQDAAKQAAEERERQKKLFEELIGKARALGIQAGPSLPGPQLPGAPGFAPPANMPGRPAVP